ncbi:carboxymuconolactone decarboxylase family protein [Burkholderia sp. Bp8992]|uniref:carboxymuconolactone decarboxylase family protein n=1 Tax=Burkholderia sp. Bp8992 TaxID=2184554 RepID=UPI000F56F2BC|nr:carboxymuconolactone decarboxylase family protein [Burkholderia sp. Bp8992]RQS25362.1 carboxymuconolactone decarboxylase family protein [Burkholderia sp. Bp8992]
MNARLTLPLLSEDTAPEKSRELLGNARKKQGFIPNMYGEMAHAPGALSTYLHGYDWFRKESRFTPAEQEVVFLTISRENACHYCIAAHSMIADKVSKVPPQAIHAIRDGATIDDPKLGALAAFVKEMVQTRGNPSEAALQTFAGAGYSEQQALQIVLAIAVKTISNYTNHLFETAVDAPFASYALPAGTK